MRFNGCSLGPIAYSLSLGEKEASVSFETADIMGAIYGDGIVSLPQAFSTAFADDLREDIETLFAEAERVENGMLARGPQRWYVEVQPERIRGFVEIVTHPWFIAVCGAVLGADYRIVEVGFDIPFPGAADQPWHRDFAVPDVTRVERRLNSLAFNLTAVDTRPDMGPFEIAPGTQWDEFDGCPQNMFPPQTLWGRYAAKARSALPQRGDISARSALTIHRGTANRSSGSRPVFVVGVDAPDAMNSAHHDLQVTPGYLAQLPPAVRDHLDCRILDRLTPVTQHHVIAGLLNAAY